MRVPVPISYLGERSYIDITTISEALYSAIGKPIRQDGVENFNFRIFRPIRRECYLVFANDMKHAMSLKREATCLVSCVYDGQERIGLIYQEGPEITARRPCPPFDASVDAKFEGGAIHVARPFNDSCIFTLMCLGKAILMKTYGREPRVVSLHFDRLFDRSTMQGLSMRVDDQPGRRFGRLISEYNGNPFGSVTVQLLEKAGPS